MRGRERESTSSEGQRVRVTTVGKKRDNVCERERENECVRERVTESEKRLREREPSRVGGGD